MNIRTFLDAGVARQNGRHRIRLFSRSATRPAAPAPTICAGAGHDPDASGAVAVFIDAENVAAARIGAVLESVRQLGPVQIVRAYGDWSTPHQGWRHAMQAHGIFGRHVPAMVRGKNAADHAIVAEAIEFRHTTGIRTMVIVSSDSDFTHLAFHLRETGCSVHGYGDRKVVPAFAAACTRFVYLDTLNAARSVTPAPTKQAAAVRKPVPVPVPKAGTATAKAHAGMSAAVVSEVLAVVGAVADSGGLSQLPKVTKRMHDTRLTEKLPTETARKHPGKYLKNCGLFDVVEHHATSGNSTTTCLRIKPQYTR
ncbi:NYN domain-containing protein [Nocardia sp. BMG111209]|uniref:NYN domain-containing protein n=1 Tax=Nocardia sp. BMG111209 TaxID=1160137 RepID=UPI00037EC89E|nr:NYN domain-containing protein [Nocardia sp. BMG111209]